MNEGAGWNGTGVVLPMGRDGGENRGGTLPKTPQRGGLLYGTVKEVDPARRFLITHGNT